MQCNLLAVVVDLILEVRKTKGGVLITYEIFGLSTHDGDISRSRGGL